jgi:hypothetical protein
MLLHLAQDVAASETEIGEGAVIERTQVSTLARPPIPIEKRAETPRENPGAEAGSLRPGLHSAWENCIHTLHLKIQNRA